MSNAFPRAGHEYDQMDWVPAPAQDGMTLRDYTAIKLMATYMSDTAVKWDTENLKRAAESAVRATDILLEELDG
jgi:hypothetical protein